MLHVNPKLARKGMLVVYNPTTKDLTKTIRVNLYYTGLTDVATMKSEVDVPKTLKLERDYSVEVPVSVRANGMSWYVFE